MTDTPIPVYRTRADIAAAITALKAEGKTIGFVPTMGALHEGHISLVTRALENADIVVASIFVNPTQFAPGEDFETYPRTEEADLAKLAAAGCSLVYMPDAGEMYPDGSVTNVRVEEMSDLLDGIYRPHFFYGVTTVVARLFLHVQPDVAVFGEKDYQQLQIIRRMVRDLGFPVKVIGGQTRRDADGLAQSSRNLYLSEDQRRVAGAIQAALHRASMRLKIGAPVDDVMDEAVSHILNAGFDRLDYVSLVHPDTLLDTDAPQGRLLAAAWIGRTRLIDNIGV